VSFTWPHKQDFSAKYHIFHERGSRIDLIQSFTVNLGTLRGDWWSSSHVNFKRSKKRIWT